VHESPGGGRNRSLLLARLADGIGQARIDRHVAIRRKRHKALREINIARGERGADFVLRDVAVERLRERAIADRHRIVCRRQLIVRGQAAANEKARGPGAKNTGNKRSHGVARYGEKTFAEKAFAVWVLHCGLNPNLS
jgi:hypothetical protein